jgi:ferric-dicitrate binding protein FerR (iron transport regulator)
MTDDDPIESLLRASGKRPDVGAPRAQRVRAAAHAAWRHEVARRTRRRRLIGATALAATILLAAALALTRRTPAPSAAGVLTVERIESAAWAETGELRPGSTVSRGSRVTTGDDARVALSAPSGHSLRLDRRTVLRVVGDRAFALERGAVYVDSGGTDRPASRPIRIETPLGVIDEVGTQFEARLDGSVLRVLVREGEVAVVAHAGRGTARAGQALTVDASGRIEQREDPGTPDDWSWTESVAPAFEIDGRSLAAFLSWVSRERGVRVRYQDPALARRAQSIVLSGSIAGMSMDQATASVLASSGLTGRWEPGGLVVGE